MEKEKLNIYFLFNDITQEYIGMTFDASTIRGKILWRRRQIEEGTSLHDVTWSGNYTDGEMSRISDGNAIVTEAEVIDKYYNRLFRKYKLETILELLIEQSIKNNDKSDESFNQFVSFYIRNKKRLEDEIEHFKNSEKHEYRSNNDVATIINNQFKV